MTIREKINKIFEYCEYTKQLAVNSGNEVRYLVEIENTYGETETDQQCAESKHIGYGGDSITFLYRTICQSIMKAQQYSWNPHCLTSVKVWIETYNSKCELIDEDPIDEYEISFENGTEVR